MRVFTGSDYGLLTRGRQCNRCDTSEVDHEGTPRGVQWHSGRIGPPVPFPPGSIPIFILTNVYIRVRSTLLEEAMVKLSDLELEVMRLIWRDKEVIAPEIHRELAQERDISYATVKTIINRLEAKKAV